MKLKLLIFLILFSNSVFSQSIAVSPDNLVFNDLSAKYLTIINPSNHSFSYSIDYDPEVFLVSSDSCFLLPKEKCKISMQPKDFSKNISILTIRLNPSKSGSLKISPGISIKALLHKEKKIDKVKNISFLTGVLIILLINIIGIPIFLLVFYSHKYQDKIKSIIKELFKNDN